ncbi:MAG TPA: HAMP domain-containing sensor histidine kinase [Candidatus Limnocylindria bacterium]|nr:HAMP domain-containing sensor histidine kinase [Candidatus Limnocylindria bacterium]
MNIFASAVRKLTLWYVGALFAVCLVFSTATYVVASNRLEHGAQKQTAIIEGFDGPTGVLIPRVKTLRDQQIAEDRQQLLRSIVLANIVILALGAYFSYQFAKQTLQPIEAAHDAQARFTTDASHELRTPLATMQAEIEVALRDKKFNAAQARQVLHSNLEEIARLRGLSEQLLGLTRLDSGSLTRVRVPISQVVAEEIAHFKKQHPDATIEGTLAPKLTIQGDEKLLRQLITILADNAIKYAGNQPARLSIELKKLDSAIQLSVADQGIGIKATEIPHIFDRFYRGSNATKHSPSGHGLGLSLAKQIVEAHDGTIQATSQPGKGSAFTVKLAPDPQIA